MKTTMWNISPVALFMEVLFFSHLVSGSFPTAQNLTWVSTNFKTLLTWGPKPSEDYSYTVEYAATGQNRDQSPHCIRTRETMCDLTSDLRQLKLTYYAEVLSEPPRGGTSDLIEFPHRRSEPFCPYQDTDINAPDFTITVGKDKRSVTLVVRDPLTALFNGTQQLTIRDVFAEQLHYKVAYRRHSSTGKKALTSAGSVVEVTGLDKGESYCFEVQAFIPSRKTEKQLGMISRPQCSEGEKSFMDEYSVAVIAGGIVLILALVIITVVVAVLCCKCRSRKSQKDQKERDLL